MFKERIINGFYRSYSSIVLDIGRLLANSKKYNEEVYNNNEINKIAAYIVSSL